MVVAVAAAVGVVVVVARLGRELLVSVAKRLFGAINTVKIRITHKQY